MTHSYTITTEAITTEKRADDWIAFADGDRAQWEAGRTEAEAIGKLVISQASR